MANQTADTLPSGFPKGLGLTDDRTSTPEERAGRNIVRRAWEMKVDMFLQGRDETARKEGK